MLSLLLVLARRTGGLQRVLLVALLTPALLLVIGALVPALAVLPFRADGTERVLRLLAAITAIDGTLLRRSLPDGGDEH